MAYKYSSGPRKFDDITAETDVQGNTKIDFEEDYIGLVTSGSSTLVVSGSMVGIGTTSPDYTLDVAGDIGVDQKIYHNGDANTYINFTDDRIRFEAGGLNLFGMHKKGSAPHQVTVNNGNNNVDFVVNTNDASTSPLLRCDASAGKVGIGTASPTEILTLNATEASILFQEGGTDMATIGINSSDNILIENKTMNKHIVFKVNDQGAVKEGFRLDGAVPEVVVNQTSDSLVDFRVESDNQTHMLFVDGSADKIGIGISVPDVTLHVHSDSIDSGAVMISQADNSGDASQLDLSKARGSGASPTAVQSNDFLGQVRFLAYDGNSYDNFADIYAQAAGTISTTSHPTKIVMRTSRVGATSPTTAITIDEQQNLIAEGNLEAKDTITIRNDNAPASASANGFKGEIRYDSNYIYVCVADNTWKRVALSSW